LFLDGDAGDFLDFLQPSLGEFPDVGNYFLRDRFVPGTLTSFGCAKANELGFACEKGRTFMMNH
jgi:hypothetical protein